MLSKVPVLLQIPSGGERERESRQGDDLASGCDETEPAQTVNRVTAVTAMSMPVWSSTHVEVTQTLPKQAPNMARERLESAASMMLIPADKTTTVAPVKSRTKPLT